LIRPPGTTLFESSDLLGVAVPGDDLDALIEEAMGHSRSHQANPEQPYAHLLLVSIGVHSVPSSSPGRPDRSSNPKVCVVGERRIEETEVKHR
jgi:hypothetical protein